MLDISSIQINRLCAPVLVRTEETPRFSWQLRSSVSLCLQTKYQIKLFVGGECVFDTGEVESGDSVDVMPENLTLTPETDYTLRLAVWDNHSQTAQAETHFSTALDECGWHGAKWITPSELPAGASPILRRKFEVKKPVAKALLYASGLGYGEYYLNGEKVYDGMIDPIATNYEKMVFYRRFDVTSRVSLGGNALALWLGEGFFGQSRVWEDHADTRYGQVCGIARLHLVYADGTEDNIVTDSGHWQAKTSPIILHNLYAGEVYDARIEDDGFALFDGSDTGWGQVVLATPPEGKLIGCDLPPVVKTKTIPVTSVTPMSGQHDGGYILDFGENFSGIFSVKIPPSPAGAMYVFRMAETLNGGGGLDYRTTGSYATQCIQQDVYIAKGDKNGEVYAPRFTYHGFRYLEVTGFYTLQKGYGAPPQAEDFTGYMLSTDMAETGHFCSDFAPLNKLYGIATHTFRSNFHGFPEDCPAREKCGWLGDAQAVCEFGLLSHETTALYEKYVDDIATTKEVYGDWNMISPGRRGCGEATPLWGCAQVLIPYVLWKYQGDSSAIVRHLPLMHEWVKHEAEDAKDYIITRGLGDWLPPCGNKSEQRMPVSHSSTLAFFEVATRMAEICHTFAPEREADYVELAAHIKGAFVKAFYQEAHHSYGYLGTDGVALYYGVYPDGEEQNLTHAILARLKDTGYQMTTAIYSTKYLVAEMARRGLMDDAICMLFSVAHPSYQTMMDQGATTLWEVLEMTVPELDPKKRMHSLSHPMHGGFLYHCFTELGGMKPLEAGYRRFAISPAFCATLGEVTVSQKTPYGTSALAYKKQGSHVKIEFTVPENTQAVLDISKANSIKMGETPIENGKIFGSGTYHITVELEISSQNS
ncbi:MAG: family 78 glycoside hydrolase catalytic domain [Clostridia bacterium]|nr:family 78 glycoside hydrolase catalytic domain [Clostridia bacterium]